MVSVCMSTYNGEKYIVDQLISILRQTRQPDEVILCDDCSDDATVTIIRRFIRENQLESKWKVYENTVNRGYPDNFYYAMGLCKGDVVFLSDQDDVWEAHKVERMSEKLQNHPELKAVCCKFGLIDRTGNDIHTVMAPVKSKGTGGVRKISIKDVFYKCEWPGMVVAYQGEWFRELWDKYCRQYNASDKLTIPHDFLVCAWAAETEGFLQMDEELAYHRRHDSNAGKEEHRIGRLLNKTRKLKEIEEYICILEAFAEEKVLQTPQGRKALEDKRITMRERYDALASGKVGEVIKNSWKNRKDVRLATAVCDIAILIKRT